MPVISALDRERGFLVSRASGNVLTTEIVAALEGITGETRGGSLYKPHLFLIDGAASVDEVSFEGLLKLRDANERWSSLFPDRRTKTAVVVCKTEHLAAAKIWQAVAEANPLVRVQVAIFTEQAQAERWLAT